MCSQQIYTTLGLDSGLRNENSSDPNTISPSGRCSYFWQWPPMSNQCFDICALDIIRKRSWTPSGTHPAATVSVHVGHLVCRAAAAVRSPDWSASVLWLLPKGSTPCWCMGGEGAVLGGCADDRCGEMMAGTCAYPDDVDVCVMCQVLLIARHFSSENVQTRWSVCYSTTRH